MDIPLELPNFLQTIACLTSFLLAQLNTELTAFQNLFTIHGKNAFRCTRSQK